MTAQDMIDRADSLRPNGFSSAAKLVWLKEIETIIHDELILTHEMPSAPRPGDSFGVLSQLCAPECYGSDVYTKYLICCIDFFNGESERYNQSVGLLSSAWRQLCDYINRTYLPKGVGIYI